MIEESDRVGWAEPEYSIPLPPNVRKIELTPAMQIRIRDILAGMLAMPEGADRRTRRAITSKNIATKRRANAALRTFIARLGG